MTETLLSFLLRLWQFLECLEDFLAALEETIYRYHDTRSTIAEHWSEKVCNAYKAYYGKTLNIPRWNDIKSKYIKEKTEE